jgi:DNA-directed RNA polymerase subunit RPC12/RpoP
MKAPLLPEPRYQCPLCGNEFSIDKIFLVQDPKSEPKPIACTRCIEKLYWTIPTKRNFNDQLYH